MVRAKNEVERLQTLKNFKIFDTPPDENRQWLKS